MCVCVCVCVYHQDYHLSVHTSVSAWRNKLLHLKVMLLSFKS